MEKIEMPQYKALKKLCGIYWKSFKDCELKHSLYSANMSIYSDGEDYVVFSDKSRNLFHEIGIANGCIRIDAKDISEVHFKKMLRFIRKELCNPIINQEEEKLRKLRSLKEKVKTIKGEIKKLST